MSWKSWVPYHGDYATRKKLRELDKAGVGIPMFIVLMLQKSFELMINSVGDDLPIPVWLTFLLAAAVTFVLWIYDHQIREKAEEAKQKVEQ
jgi:NADH:ubiquinone oxidoreductase subunit 6 (subunit J)